MSRPLGSHDDREVLEQPVDLRLLDRDLSRGILRHRVQLATLVGWMSKQVHGSVRSISIRSQAHRHRR